MCILRSVATHLSLVDGGNGAVVQPADVELLDLVLHKDNAVDLVLDLQQLGAMRPRDLHADYEGQQRGDDQEDESLGHQGARVGGIEVGVLRIRYEVEVNDAGADQLQDVGDADYAFGEPQVGDLHQGDLLAGVGHSKEHEEQPE